MSMPDEGMDGVERREEPGWKPGLPMAGLQKPVLLQAFDPEAEFEVRARRLPDWRHPPLLEVVHVQRDQQAARSSRIALAAGIVRPPCAG